ncbi:MAG: sulfite exporter TauE/SafE family protein [Saprospiraceae bacterium]|nr:sulfite exporter TauE/SafE family protein [Saprospiraceae bacterium]
MEYFLIPLVSFLVAILTFFSGFGLGTILTPVFMIFFPIDVAIALTGVVHFFNNIFKLFLTVKHVDKKVLWRFGLPAIAAAFLGSYIMIHITDIHPFFRYTLFGKEFLVLPFKLTVAFLLIIFATIEILPYFKNIRFNKKWLPLGGLLSGFFGGLSGNQGALRAAFLINAGLTKEVFISTTVVVSTLVDFTRLGVYATRFSQNQLSDNITLVVLATLSGIAGSYIGNKLLKKVTIEWIRNWVTGLLFVLAISLALGWL